MIKTLIAVVTASLLGAVVLGFAVIPLLKKLKMRQTILKYVTEHSGKAGTPTMGGIIFILPAVVVFFLSAGTEKLLASICAAVGCGFMVVGFLDDFIKVVLKRNLGLKAYQKILFQSAISIIVAVFCYRNGMTKIYIPFTGKLVDTGIWFIPLCVFVFLAAVNSVNLTDGLDGLAGGVTYVYLSVIAVLILLQTIKYPSNYVYTKEYLNLSVLSAALSGGIMGYLLFNTFKASVFMGDTGSLALGGFVASISIFSGNMFFIPILGIMYVLSSISVILQVASFRLTGKRVFLMAPLHHHFQHKGFAESKIVFAYKLVTFVVGLVILLFYF